MLIITRFGSPSVKASPTVVASEFRPFSFIVLLHAADAIATSEITPTSISQIPAMTLVTVKFFLDVGQEVNENSPTWTPSHLDTIPLGNSHIMRWDDFDLLVLAVSHISVHHLRGKVWA